MPDGYEDEARDALLAKAAQAWEDDPALDVRALGPQGQGDGSEDSVSCYLRAYYQRVATEDLAPPSRLAAAAQAHAGLGLTRPQGRALVQLRGILGVCAEDAGQDQPASGELTESWIHVELGPLRDKVTADELAAELRHVLDDVRVAVEDQPRMVAAARALAGDLGQE